MTHLITAIEPSEDDPNMRDIYVQDKFAMTLTMSMVEELQLTVSQEWDNTLSDEVAMHSDVDEARKVAIDLISRRMWGSGELHTRLVKRGTDKTVAKITIEQLVEDGWLDDHAFACALIREWLRKEPASRRWLQHKLYEKSISSEIAKDAIEEELTDISEQDSANAFAVKRLAKSYGDEESIRRKVISALSRKGFPMAIASEAFRKAQIDPA
jgi:regulatory protein